MNSISCVSIVLNCVVIIFSCASAPDRDTGVRLQKDEPSLTLVYSQVKMELINCASIALNLTAIISNRAQAMSKVRLWRHDH